MAAYLNRATSMITGDSFSSNGASRNASSLAAHADSPLQVFVRAKKKINDIFVEIHDTVKDGTGFLQDIDNKAVIEDEQIKEVNSYVDKVKAIRDVLCRDHMKVAFFGRTSNGKSTVINAMLHEKILPSGIGHTTNCFLQVEGSENNESYLLTENSTDRHNVQTVGQLAHALCDTRLQECELVHIFWPKEKCGLLRDDVVFVDSPGVDVTPNLDEWIDNHCIDADVFVLVANSESTLMVTEKNFFHKVSSKLSKPNIFILNNRWDASASEPEYLDQVRSQHTSRCADFLVKELKVCTTKEAEERIFFISAKEALLTRLKDKNAQTPTSPGGVLFAEGFQTRYFEFQDFERKFQECISRSAVRTKFQQHSQRGRSIIVDLKTLLESVQYRASTMRQNKLSEKEKIHEELNRTERELMNVTKEMKHKIRFMVDDVEQRVSRALNEEIRRLSTLVEDFNVPFHSDQLVINIYKKELHSHVENGLGSNLKARLSDALALNIESAQNEMTEKLCDLLPSEEKKQAGLTCVAARREPFQVFYRINCENLCADFQEDLQFRFSWGLSAMILRFQGKNSHRLAIRNNAQHSNQHQHNNQMVKDIAIPRPLGGLVSSDHPDGTIASYAGGQIGPLSAEQWTMVSKVALATFTSQGTVGGLLVAGFMLKTVGWRVIAVAGALYGALYAYERLTWTNRAKEKLFKRQYVQHATRKLRLIVDLTSANCSHQVQQELSSTFAQLCHLVDEANTEMDSRLHELDAGIQTLEKTATSAKKLINKSNYLNNELDIFDEAFLKNGH